MIENHKIRTENVISFTLRGLAEGLTGAVTSSQNELMLPIRHTFQRMRGGQLLSVLLNLRESKVLTHDQKD